MSSLPFTTSWEDALQRLKAGNERFVNGLCSVDSLINRDRLRNLSEQGQKPFAIILSCSDSRVPAEIVFDQGIGTLFVIRVAGNIIQPSQLASIEFAVDALRTPLCIVMGHTQCGAIRAALEIDATGTMPNSPNLCTLMELILPAVKEVKKEIQGDNPERLLHETTLRNVVRMTEAILEKSPLVAGYYGERKIGLIGALFEIENGRVSFDVGKTA